MASTYSNTGIELIADGEQSGTWGQTTNRNWQIAEELATGVVSISLGGTTYTLTTSDGVLSNGRHAVIEFTGSPGDTCTVTVSPSDMQKTYWVVNGSDQDVTITQGTGGNVTIASGSKKAIYCDGAGTGAEVVDLFKDIVIDVDSLSIAGTGITATADEINYLDITTLGASEASKVLTADSDGDISIGGALTFSSLIDTAETPITITGFADEDDMTSDSEELVPTQQSVKTYVDNTVSSSANETGKVLQVVTGVTSTVSVSSYTNGEWNDTAVTVSFTPKALGSTFLVEVFAHFGANDYGGLALKSQVDAETAVEITGSNGTGSRTSALAHVSYYPSLYGPQPVSFAYLDDSIVYDADSETITYTVLARPSAHSSGYQMFLNRGIDTTDRDLAHYIASSTIKVTEIAG